MPKRKQMSSGLKRPPARTRRRRVLVALEYNDQQLHWGIAAYAHKAGWVLDVSMTRYGQLPDHWRGDGIITLLLPPHKRTLEWIRRSGAPAVSLNADASPELPGVVLDHEATGRLVADHFLHRGVESFAYFRCSDLPDVVGRQKGFVETIERAGKKPILLDGRDGETAETAPTALAKRISRMPRPVGIMSQSDHRAPRLFAACEEAGLAIPDEVVIIGVDNDELACEFAPVPLSSVDSNRRRLAWEGAAMLDRLMDGEAPPTSPTLVAPVGIVHRKSSDLLKIPHKGVVAALRFLNTHYREPIHINEVVSAVAMSRCGLYRAFEKHVGRSLGEELLRLRIDYAKRLLATTDEKMYAVAVQSGFTSGEHFSKAFARAVGITPSEYRRRNAAM